jgi:hypothetical protein
MTITTEAGTADSATTRDAQLERFEQATEYLAQSR